MTREEMTCVFDKVQKQYEYVNQIATKAIEAMKECNVLLEQLLKMEREEEKE